MAKLLRLASRWMLIGAAVIVVQAPAEAQDIDEVRRSAEQGDVNAQHKLGRMYDIGEGVPQDYADAAGWFRLAAEQGHAEAQYNVGVMYANGQGVPQDFVSAYMWIELAAATGFEDARTARDVIAAMMTGIQIAEAQARARELRIRSHSATPSLRANR